MKKYLAIAVLGLMLVLVQPASAQYGCPVPYDPCCPACPVVQPACPIVQPACPVCPPVCQPVCQPACPVCPPQLVYQPVLQQVQPVIQTVVEPVMSYRYRQISVCPTQVNPCAPYGFTGAAAPITAPQTIIYEEDEGFWSDFLGFD